ncbi:hypothetical protein [Stutzerimonas nitrititolerans]|uniref:hypothetical protein n=1 Tax=Stutzerimonas nitrititolerans TaxID=2482751 RepID=UPI0028ACA3E2|nr:hypothetical protein [Stutzerimonas nitrititolerans]
MSESAAKGVVTVGKGDSIRDVVVSELTVAQMRQLMMANAWPGDDADADALAHYQLDVHLFEECRLTDLSVLANLSRERMSELTGTELRKIIAKAKELNPDFFAALGRLAKAQSGR